MSKIRFSCVAAMDLNGGIGKDGTLAWRLRGDMQFFKNLTTKVQHEVKENVVLMGRKTWESIPEKFRPLPKRVNIVLSRMMTEPPVGAHYLCNSLEDALNLIGKEPLASKIERVFVIGGGTVYKDAMCHDSCHKLYLTEIDKDYDCDVFYPEFDKNVFQLSSDEDTPTDVMEEKGVSYKFCVYERK